MDKNTINVKQVFIFSGAIIAFLIGSGFATGQETMQYYVSYGLKGIAGGAVVFFLLVYVGTSFIITGYKQNFKKPSEVFSHYCGRIVGKFYDYFSVFFIFLSFMVMVGGAGATINQQYGLPISLGGIGMGVLVGTTVIFGFQKMVDIIGKIGPALVVMTILLGVTTIFMNTSGIAEANQVLPKLNLLQASTNWFYAAFSYVGLCILWLAPFMTKMGAGATNKKTATLGATLGALGFALGVIVLTLALLANLQLVEGSFVPTLVLAGSIHPSLGFIFSLMVVIAIYSTSVPLLWTVSSRLSDENSTKFKYITILLTTIGTIVGLYVPFDKLVNIAFVFNGYVGFIFIGFMLIKSIKNIVLIKRFKDHRKLDRKVTQG